MKKPAPKSKSAEAAKLDAEKVRIATSNANLFSQNVSSFRAVAPLPDDSPLPPLKQTDLFLRGLFHVEHLVVYSHDLFNTYLSKVGEFKPKWDGSKRGVYVKVNRLTVAMGSGEKGGVRDQDCATDYMLVELDKASLQSQFSLWACLIELGFPVYSLTHSRGKSLHAVIRLKAADLGSYRSAAVEVFNLLSPFLPDTTCRNPSRYTRLPGFKRDGKIQSLLYHNPAAGVWTPELACNEEIRDWCEGLESPPESVVSSLLRATERTSYVANEQSDRQRKEFNAWSRALPLQGVLDMEALIEELGWESSEMAETKQEKKFYIECPWSEDHGGGGDSDGPKDAYVYERKTSAKFRWGFHCSHDACQCAGRNIKDVFDLLVADHPDELQAALAPLPDMEEYFDEEPGESLPEAPVALGKPAPETAVPADGPEEAKTVKGTGELLDMLPSEYTEALLFQKLHGDRVHYLHDEKVWLIWGKGVWGRDKVEKIRELAKDGAKERIKRATTADVKEMMARAGSSAMIDGILKTSRSVKPISSTSDKFDANPWLLGCQNGVLDLRTMKLGMGDPKDKVSLRCGVRYNPGASYDRWVQSLNESFPDNPEIVEFLQTFMGYCLTGLTMEQKMLIFYGTGRNGKSTFLDHVMKVLGDYGISSPKSLVIANPRGDDPGAASPALADLGRRRFSCISETEANSKLAESKVKDLISGETIRARQLHAGYQDLRVIAKLVLSSNHIPNIAGTDTGIWRRVLLVEFKEDFTGREDLSLNTILENEHEGILNWALEGCRRYQEEGLTVPDTVKSATIAFRESQDVMGQFLRECCIEHPDGRAPQKDAYKAYRHWAAEWGLNVSSGTAFNKKIKERGFPVHPRDGYPHWWGFSLKDDVTIKESD